MGGVGRWGISGGFTRAAAADPEPPDGLVLGFGLLSGYMIGAESSVEKENKRSNYEQVNEQVIGVKG